MRVVLKERNFLLFFVAIVISLLGDWALFIALPFFVYVRTGSVAATGGLVVAELLPRLLLSSFAGVLADRWNRRLTVVGVDLFRAVLVLLLLVPASGGGIWLVYVVAVIQSVAAQVFGPAFGALLPAIVSRRDRLLPANSLLATGESVVRVVGPALGGALYAAFGLGVSAVADGASFALAAMVIVAVRPLVASAAGVGPARTGGTRFAFWRELIEGARYVAARQELTTLFAVVGVANLAQGILQTIMLPFVRELLHVNALQYSLLPSAEGFGSLAGAFGVGLVRQRLTRGAVVGWGLMATGLVTFGFAFARSIVVAAVFIALLCAGIVVVQVWMQTFYQQRVDGRVLGRVLGLTTNVSALGIVCGVAVATILGSTLGVRVPIIAGAAALFASGVLAAGLLRHVSTVDAEPAQQRAVEMPSG